MTHPFSEIEYFDKTYRDLHIDTAEITDVTFEDCTFKHCSFRDTVWQRCTFRDCHFLACDLSLAQVNHSIFSGNQFEQTKAIGINWTAAAWQSTHFLRPTFTFDECDLSYSTFIGLKLEKLVLKNSKATEVDFSEAILQKANFTHSDFAGSNFNRADLTAADFTHAKNYAIDIRNTILKKAKFSAPEALALLQVLGIKIEM